MNRTEGWMDGEVHVLITGRRLEQFVNLVLTRGINLWGISREDDGIRFWMRAADFSRLRPVARKSRCRVRILGRRGLPFLYRAVFGRGSMLLGALLCVALVLTVSSFVWVIEVDGLQHGDRREVLEAARELGLARGAWIYSLDLGQAGRDLARKVPYLTWVGVERRGVRLTIKVVEKVGEHPEPVRLSDVVAVRDGIVRDVLVLSGTPVVTEGDHVIRGQTLIGAITEVPGGSEISGRGRVLAEVHHEHRETVYLVDEVTSPTGREFVRTSITLGEHGPLLVSGLGEVPFDVYDVVRTTWRPPGEWRRPPLFVEVERVYYKELSRHVRELSEIEALRLACARAHNEVLSRVPPDARVLSRDCEVVARGGDYVQVEVRAVVVADIGEERPLVYEDSEPKTHGGE